MRFTLSWHITPDRIYSLLLLRNRIGDHPYLIALLQFFQALAPDSIVDLGDLADKRYHLSPAKLASLDSTFANRYYEALSVHNPSLLCSFGLIRESSPIPGKGTHFRMMCGYSGGLASTHSSSTTRTTDFSSFLDDIIRIQPVVRFPLPPLMQLLLMSHPDAEVSVTALVSSVFEGS